MGFWTGEPSSYYRDIIAGMPTSSGDLADQDSLRLADEQARQTAARGGFSSLRGTALNTANRLKTGILTDRDRRKFQESMQSAQLKAAMPVTPSAFSQIAGPILGGVGYGMGPALGKALAGGIASGGQGLWNMGTQGASAAYNALMSAPDYSAFAPAAAGAANYGAGEEALSGITNSDPSVWENIWNGISGIFG